MSSVIKAYSNPVDQYTPIYIDQYICLREFLKEHIVNAALKLRFRNQKNFIRYVIPDSLKKICFACLI